MHGLDSGWLCKEVCKYRILPAVLWVAICLAVQGYSLSFLGCQAAGVGLDSWGVGVQRKLSGEGKYTLHLEKSGNKINLSVKIS